MITRYLKIVLAFIITTTAMCVVNFIAQVLLIFVDIISQWESSAALIIVLWIVTGVFAAIFTEATAALFMNKEEITYQVVHYPVLITSIVCIGLAIGVMLNGEFMSDPSEFTLLFSNGFVFLSYFFGSAAMSFIARKL